MARNIRSRFIIATVGLATIPVLVLGVAAGVRSAAELQRQSVILQTEIAGRIERDVAGFVSTRLSELRLLERSSQFVRANEDATSSTLARLLAHDRVYETVALVAPDGTVRASASRTGSTQTAEDRWAKTPAAQPGFWNTNTDYVGPIEYEMEVREPLIDIAIPVIERRSGRLDGILFVQVRFKPIWDLLADLPLPAGTAAFVVDADGRVVAHRSPAVVLARSLVSLPETPGRHPLPNGGAGLVVWEPLSVVGGEARVVVTRSIEDALASASTMLRTTIVAASMLLGVATVIALQQARSIARPIEALAESARRISSGHLDTRIESSGPEEIATLGTVLGAMTERLQGTIAQLERSEFAARQRALVTLQSIGDAVITADTESRIVYVNPVAEVLTGWTQEEAEGQRLTEVFRIVDGTTRAPATNPVDRCLAINDIVELANDTILIRRDGSEMIIADSAAPIREIDGTVQGVVMVFRDVTERKAMEAAAQQSQKMEAIGQLTGGIAHDFNNLLQVIQGHAELLMEGYERESAESIARAAQHGAELTSRLLAFGRRQTLMPRPIDIRDLVEDLMSMLSRTIGETYDIRVEVAADTWPALADPGQLEAAILNLSLNARDAMPKGGQILIAAHNVGPGEPKLETSDQTTDGDFVAIAISDIGDGMSEETLAKAVEPFYTTKGVGEGSGLGLSMVFGFARQSGGHLDIESALGAGTTVTMYLPRAPEVIEAAHGPKPRSTVQGGGETILVVEDDTAVRTQAERSLKSLGYRVVTAENVSSARVALQIHAEIDLVLTDVVLPGGESGADLARELARNWPGLPVCLMSGYPQLSLDDGARTEADLPLLNKPFSRSDLAATVASLLGPHCYRVEGPASLTKPREPFA